LTQASIANTTYEIDYKIKDVENFSVTVLSGTVNIFSYADIADAGKFNSSTSGNTLLRNTDLNTLVYPYPRVRSRKHQQRVILLVTHLRKLKNLFHRMPPEN